jgi:V/A-type H+-transporting ATPase subunit E
MQTLESGQDKIAAICKTLKEETLEPAKHEAARIISEAREEAKRIEADAHREAEAWHSKAKQEISQERNVFHSSLLQAGKQSIASLRQDIEQKLFNQELSSLVETGSTDPKLIAKLVEALAGAVSSEGIQVDLSAVVPKAVSRNEVTEALGKSVVDRLRGNAVEVGSFKGGAQLKWHDRKLTLDISDGAIKELLSQYVRKDFRNLLFGE